MSIKVHRVRVKNFRSLQDVETTLEEVTLLLGANNSGKTSFLRALTIALNGDRKFLSRDDLFINSQGNYPANPRIEVDIEIRPIGDNEFSTKWAEEFGNDIMNQQNEEFLAYKAVVDFTAQQTEAQIKRYIIRNWDLGVADETVEVSANLKTIPLFFIDAQRDLQEDLKLAQSYFGRLAAQIQYDPTQKTSLETALNDLNEQAVANSPILAHLKDALEELNRTVQTRGSGVEITPFPKKLRDLHKGLKVNFQDGSSESFSLEYHGMGTRSWASLLGYKAFVQWIKKQADDNADMLHPVLALEEPEAHLHPNAQRQVYSQLKNITGQKIISTHSPYIAPLAAFEELRVFYKAGDSTSISDLKQLVIALNASEKYVLQNLVIRERGELFFARIVVLFEGQTEENALPLFAKKHWGCGAFEKGVSFINCQGDSFDIYTRFLESLQIPWIIFGDYDNPTVQGKINKVGTNLGIDVSTDDRFVLLNASIEHYLVDEGYRTALEEAYFAAKAAEYSDQTRRATEWTRVRALSDDDYKADKKALKDYKAKMGPLWAQYIIDNEPAARKIPPKIKDLFTVLDLKL